MALLLVPKSMPQPTGVALEFTTELYPRGTVVGGAVSVCSDGLETPLTDSLNQII
jgi:hypothetical protein